MKKSLLPVAVAVLVLIPATLRAAPCAGFNDVDDASGFCTSIAWMKNRAITLGCVPDGSSYCPGDFVRRDQMAAFLWRLGFQNALLNGGNSFGATAVLGTTDGHAVELRVGGTRAMRYEPNPVSPNVIGGSSANNISVDVRGATIAGGGVPAGNSDPNFANEAPNRVTDHYGTVGGGFGNRAGDDHPALFGSFATVGGGYRNTASGTESTVVGGDSNTASAGGATVVGGSDNVASGSASTVAGGSDNVASGSHSLAAGIRAKAVHDHAFVWNGDLGNDTASLAYGDFVVYAPGRIRLFAGSYGSGGCEIGSGNVGGNLTCQGVITANSFVPASDRALKADVVPVDHADVLARVVAMPIAEWSYVSAPDVRHMGPMGQDFRAAFGLGATDKGIATVDADGVALAAIQGLNAKVESIVAAKDGEIAALKREIAELRRAIDVLATGASGQARVALSP